MGFSIYHSEMPMRGLLIRTVNELKEFAQVHGNMAVK